jgi:anti-sigma regulatory factor (Ser/Thr protein kinase)
VCRGGGVLEESFAGALDGAGVEEAALVVAELLANVVDHAQTTFRLAVRLNGRLLHVGIDDSRVGSTPPGRTGRRPGKGAECTS